MFGITLNNKNLRLIAELKNSILSERFIELMSVESKHKDLLKEFDQVAEDLYYEKLEKKEQLEEKMLSIYKMECKAVRCMKVRPEVVYFVLLRPILSRELYKLGGYL